MPDIIHSYGSWLGAVAFLSLLHLPGCGGGVGRDCEVDSDCAESQICADSQCARTCTTDQDCTRTTYTCRSWIDSPGDDPINVCRPSADAGGGDADQFECTTNEECQSRYDAGQARCGIDGRCVITERRYGLLIRDRTEVTDQGPEARRGTEIGAVFLIDETGAPTSHARTVQYDPGAGLAGDAHIDGSDIALDGANQCVTPPLADNTTPLGSGDLLVEFGVETGDAPAIAPGEQAAIVEWAQDNCGDSEGDVDEYDVYLCVSETGTIGTDDCQDPLAEGATGYRVVTPRPED